MRRSGFLSIHRWLGLIFAPFLLLQALTGATLVLHELTLPATIPPSTAPVSALISAAEEAQPSLRVKRLYLPGSTGAAAFAEMAGPGNATAYAEVDPATGQVIRSGGLWRFPYRAALRVHYQLADGTTGMTVILALGLALALSALSGLAFWWPGRGRVVQALKVRRQLPARLRLRHWHRSIGAVTAAFALFSAVTGTMLIVPDLLPVSASPNAAGPPRPSAAMIDNALDAARQRFPSAPLRDIRFPAADRLDINFDAPERNSRAVHTLSVRLSDAKVTKSIAAEDNPVLWMKVLALHTGEALPLLGPVLLLAEAVALVFLALVGTRMWFASRRRNLK